jgi:hypothetical protein
MTYLLIKAALSGVVVMAISEVARRSPGFGGLIASLPLVSILAMIWLAGYGRHRAHRGSIGSDLLVCPAVAADVLSPSGDASARAGILADPRLFLPSDHGLLFFDGLDTFPVRSPALARLIRALALGISINAKQ